MIKVTASGLVGEELLKAVTEDILRFDKFFQKVGSQAPLVNSEVAIIKSYLWYKLHEAGKEQP